MCEHKTGVFADINIIFCKNSCLYSVHNLLNIKIWQLIYKAVVVYLKPQQKH